MNKNLFPLFLVLSLFTACSAPQTKTGTINSKDIIFPFGTYKHEVSLQIYAANNQPEVKKNFNGVVKIEADKIQVVALSPLNTTLFRLTDLLNTNEITCEIFLEQLKPLEGKFKNYYLLLKQVLIHKQGEDIVENRKIQLDDESSFTLGQFDKNKIPESFILENLSYKIDVKVTGYDL